MSNKNPKFCAECGGPLQAGAKFCPGCGARTVPDAASHAAAAPAVAAAEEVEVPKAGDHLGFSHADHASGKNFADPLSEVLDHQGEDDHDDQLGLPVKGDPAAKRSLPMGMIAFGGLMALFAGMIAYITMDPIRSAAFQCNILGKKDMCETDEARKAKIEEAEAQQEQDLMVNRSGQFDLNFSPDEDASVLVVIKRYEEDRKSFIGRVTGSVPCTEQADCPANYKCDGAPPAEGAKNHVQRRCTPTNGIGDNRVFKEKKVGDVLLGKPDTQGVSKATVRFVTEETWRANHPLGSIKQPKYNPAASMAGPEVAVAAGQAAPEPEMIDVAGPLSWWPHPATKTETAKKITLPMTLQTLPLLEKEQCAPVSAEKDAKCERLNPEKIKEIEKKRDTPVKDAEGNIVADPTTRIKTTDLSTYTYEIELSAPGYKSRKVLFFDDPAPPDVDTKKLEQEGWTVRKFKRTPDGKFLIDNASFDLVPEPATLRIKYLSLLKNLQCLRLSPDFKGKTEALRLDAEERVKEENFFNRDKWAIAIENEKEPAFVEYKNKELKEYKCPKVE